MIRMLLLYSNYLKLVLSFSLGRGLYFLVHRFLSGMIVDLIFPRIAKITNISTPVCRFLCIDRKELNITVTYYDKSLLEVYY